MSNAVFRVMQRPWFWPAVIIGMLSTHVLLWISVAIIATTDSSFAIEPGYYEKAVAWDKSATVHADGEKLGWSLTWSLSEATSENGPRALRATLRNRTGIALDGATIHVQMFGHANANERREFQLEPCLDGVYERACERLHRGIWEIRVLVERGPDQLTSTHLFDIQSVGLLDAAARPES